MAKAEQIEALVNTHFRRDDAHFKAIVLQIAAHDAEKSPKFAERLRRLIDRTPTILSPLPMNSQAFLEVRTKLATFDEMALAPEVAERLERVVREHDLSARLLERNLLPSRRLLFVGAPGVGKTMAAGALAVALKMPLFRVSLHTLIASHLGETASNMGKVFDTMRTVPGVFLFDEFDALASDRADNSRGDAREMARAINSLLMFIEDFEGPGILIGATNLMSKIDSAMFRRFDHVIMFRKPTEAQVAQILGMYDDLTDIFIPDVVAELGDLGHADLRLAIEDALRDHVVDDIQVTTVTIVEALRRRRKA